MQALPWITAVVIMALALFHGAWAIGWTWPARDQQSLARAVVGGPVGVRMPGPGACLGIAVLLVLAALLLLGATDSVALALPAALLRVGAYLVMAVFLLRGAAGFFALRIEPSLRGSPFVRLNMLIYSPLSLALGVLVLLSLRPH